MATYYYNGDKILAPFKIISNKPVFASDTVSLKHIRATQSSQRWELSFNTLSNDNVANAFLSILDEMDAAKTMIMPQFPEVDKLRTASGVLGSAGAETAGVSTITVDFINGDGILPKGSFIKFSNHDKVYVTKNDVDLSSETTQELSIYPDLTVSLSVPTQILYGSDCVIRYYRDINAVQGVQFNDGILANQGTVTLIEAL